MLLDVDALAAAEKENWVFKGAERAPSLTRALVELSRGGGDAVVTREFDLAAKAFVADGFVLAEAKSSACYLDDDTVLFATDFGEGSLTASGYARIVKLWHRGTPVAEAQTIYEGRREDVLVAPAIFHGPDGSVALIVRAVSFFETEYFALHAGRQDGQAAAAAGRRCEGAGQGPVAGNPARGLDAWTAPPTARDL